jgi:antitoxin component YwqK of YwqJK toxin-antitoxin module
MIICITLPLYIGLSWGQSNMDINNQIYIGVPQNQADIGQLIKRGDRWFQKNQEQPFTGILFERSKKTDKRILECEYNQGLMNGRYQEWYDDGTIKNSGYYREGQPEDEWSEWYPNGQKSDEITYKNGQRHGVWTEWYETGEKLYEGTYSKGREHGKHIKWYDGGQKAFEYGYHKGEKDGLWMEWYENGQKMYENRYAKDQWNGLWIGWYMNGQKKYELQHEGGQQVYQYCWDEAGNDCDCNWYFETGCQ